MRDCGYTGLRGPSLPDSPRFALASLPYPPPPIDPGVFRSVTTICRLIDEASELAVRASGPVTLHETSRRFGWGGRKVSMSPL